MPSESSNKYGMSLEQAHRWVQVLIEQAFRDDRATAPEVQLFVDEDKSPRQLSLHVTWTDFELESKNA